MQELKGEKMKWKNRLTNYNFWISIVSAVLLILQAFNFEFDIAYINEIATAVLGLLVVIGIICDPTKTYTPSEGNTKNTEENICSEELFEQAEEQVKEKESVSTNCESENVSFNSESNFKAIIDFLSKEINKTVKEVVKLDEKSEENLTPEIKEEKPQEIQESYNIVN